MTCIASSPRARLVNSAGIVVVFYSVGLSNRY
jgi:hypothetical protein